ncbi:MAG: radical SAM protein, partial [Acidobacteria bacterium]|nr:radical SAM protein [Acidobacteriota bacterium]
MKDLCHRKKILLMLLPFWTPMIPPQGISFLKGFLQEHGYVVKTKDANLEHQFKKLYDKYFNTLKSYVPSHQLGNFYNIGNDVWREHMMAHINYDDEKKYQQLVKILVYKVFYHHLDDRQVVRLNDILSEFYLELTHYVLAILEEERPDVLGISVFRDTLPASLFAFRTAKNKYPHLLTVMGGGLFSIQLPKGSPNWDYFMKRTGSFIDKIIVGEGEKLLLNILEGKFPGSQRLFTKEDLPAEAPGFPSLDIYDYSDFDHRHYHYLAAQASAGCPNQCSFCNVNSFYGAYRKKNAAQVVEEMIQLHKRYGGRLFFMLDSLLNQSIMEISQEFVNTGISLYWDAYFRVDESCTRANARLWRQGGFYRARIGIESGSQRILDLMNKGITVDQINSTISNLAAAGI